MSADAGSSSGYVLAHLSDLHLRGDGDLVGGVVDTRAHLEDALAVLDGWGSEVDAWVFSGDLADDASPAAYIWLADRVLPLAHRHGVRVIWGDGNHDAATPLRAGLRIGGDGPVLAEHQVRDLRVLTVPSAVPGTPAGHITTTSLTWLRERLTSPAPDGTVLVVHHAPLPQPQTAAALWPLVNADELATVILGSDVRLILSGHFHQSGFGMFAGVPVSVATSLAYTQDVTRVPDLRGQDAHVGFSRVEIDQSGPRVTVVPLVRGRSVHPILTHTEARRRLEAEG
ncbi:MAG: metallophosphoesterase [Propioniciclava sp.]